MMSFAPGNSNQPGRQTSLNNLNLDTQMANQSSIFGSLGPTGASYDSPMDVTANLDIDIRKAYLQ
jgi:hypothetical protein